MDPKAKTRKEREEKFCKDSRMVRIVSEPKLPNGFHERHSIFANELKCGHSWCSDCLRELFIKSIYTPSLMPPKCCNIEIDGLSMIPLLIREEDFDPNIGHLTQARFSVFIRCGKRSAESLGRGTQFIARIRCAAHGLSQNIFANVEEKEGVGIGVGVFVI